jgi:hypothetical protein
MIEALHLQKQRRHGGGGLDADDRKREPEQSSRNDRHETRSSKMGARRSVGGVELPHASFYPGSVGAKAAVPVSGISHRRFDASSHRGRCP